MAALPPELMEDILLRLPVKSLLRFRSISKPCCALIDTPDFTKNHLNRSIATKSNRSLYLINKSSFSCLDISSLQTSFELQLRFGDPFHDSVIGSCNGLLLLLYRKDIALFNPVTRQYRIIRRPPATPAVDYFHYSKTESYSLGYDSVNHDYKVIKFVQAEAWDRSSIICKQAQIYSLKSNSWRDIEGKLPWCNYDYLLHWGLEAHLNGCLHRVVVSFCDDPRGVIVVSFDLATEKSHLIPLPDDFPVENDILMKVKVGVLEGYLCVWTTHELRTDIWIMREYGVNSWFKFLSIGPPHLSRYRSLCPLALSRNGREVLLNIDDKDLIWYDLERRSVRKTRFHGMPYMFRSEVSVDNLIPLDNSRKSVGIEKEVKEEGSKESKWRTIIITREMTLPRDVELKL